MPQSVPEEDDRIQEPSHVHKPSAGLGSGTETDVAQWNVLQFNTGSTTPFIIKCGANSNSELVIKADARVQEPKGGDRDSEGCSKTICFGKHELGRD